MTVFFIQLYKCFICVKIIYDYLSEKYTEEDITNINSSIINIIKQVSEDNNILIEDIKV